jgi:hypothetical protein
MAPLKKIVPPKAAQGLKITKKSTVIGKTRDLWVKTRKTA